MDDKIKIQNGTKGLKIIKKFGILTYEEKILGVKFWYARHGNGFIMTEQEYVFNTLSQCRKRARQIMRHRKKARAGDLNFKPE